MWYWTVLVTAWWSIHRRQCSTRLRYRLNSEYLGKHAGSDVRDHRGLHTLGRNRINDLFDAVVVPDRVGDQIEEGKAPSPFVRAIFPAEATCATILPVDPSQASWYSYLGGTVMCLGQSNNSAVSIRPEQEMSTTIRVPTGAFRMNLSRTEAVSRKVSSNEPRALSLDRVRRPPMPANRLVESSRTTPPAGS